MALYKYKSLENFSHVSEMLENSQLYFARPVQLNDPLDCKPIIEVGDVSKLRNLLQKKFNSSLLNGRRISDVMVDLSDLRTQEDLFYRIINEKTGVCSASTTPTSILQWSYYADSHRGICIEIDDSKLPSISHYDVNYSGKRCSILLDEFLDDRDTNSSNLSRIAVETLTTKAKCWEQEEEVRFISLKPGSQKIDHEAITSVIFGLRTSKESIEIIRDMITKKGTNIHLKKIVHTGKSFELEIVELD